jgi:hypothetical protein
MLDPSDSTPIAEPEDYSQSRTAHSTVMDDPTPDLDTDTTTVLTVLTEVLPGTAVVFGEVPATHTSTAHQHRVTRSSAPDSGSPSPRSTPTPTQQPPSTSSQRLRRKQSRPRTATPLATWPHAGTTTMTLPQGHREALTGLVRAQDLAPRSSRYLCKHPSRPRSPPRRRPWRQQVAFPPRPRSSVDAWQPELATLPTRVTLHDWCLAGAVRTEQAGRPPGTGQDTETSLALAAGAYGPAPLRFSGDTSRGPRTSGRRRVDKCPKAGSFDRRLPSGDCGESVAVRRGKGAAGRTRFPDLADAGII